MYFKKLSGTKCYLSPIDVNDAETYTRWLNDLEITENLTIAATLIPLEGERDLLQKLAVGSPAQQDYAIVNAENDTLIGNAGLININHLHRTAEAGIFIGDKSCWNRGFGTEALSLLIDYAYRVLNLHNIMLRTYAFNKRAIRCYEKIGFKKIGEIRDAHIYGGKAHNIVLMDIVPDDFYAQNGYT